MAHRRPRRPPRSDFRRCSKPSHESATVIGQSSKTYFQGTKKITQLRLRRLPPEARKSYRAMRPRSYKLGKKAEDLDVPRMERVRVNSAIVLAYLAKAAGQTPFSLVPHTFLRPFRFLSHFHDKMEEALRPLEEAFGKGNHYPATSEYFGSNPEGTLNRNDTTVSQGTVESAATLAPSFPIMRRPASQSP